MLENGSRSSTPERPWAGHYGRAFGAEEFCGVEDAKGGSVRTITIVEDPDAMFDRAVSVGATVVWQWGTN